MGKSKDWRVMTIALSFRSFLSCFASANAYYQGFQAWCEIGRVKKISFSLQNLFQTRSGKQMSEDIRRCQMMSEAEESDVLSKIVVPAWNAVTRECLKPPGELGLLGLTLPSAKSDCDVQRLHVLTAESGSMRMTDDTNDCIWTDRASGSISAILPSSCFPAPSWVKESVLLDANNLRAQRRHGTNINGEQVR